MIERKWMPSEYMDESVPPARAIPSDWIVKMDDGNPALAPGDPYDDDAPPTQPLTEGQIVKFDWTEHYGNFGLTFHNSDDFGWTWTLHGEEPTASPGADMMVAAQGDWDTMALSLREFASEYVREVKDGDTVTVTFYAWSRHSIPFVFRDGGFHAVAEPAP